MTDVGSIATIIRRAVVADVDIGEDSARARPACSRRARSSWAEYAVNL